MANRQRAVRVDARRLAELARFVARREGVPLGEADLAVVGRREMRALNRRWRGRARATDVLCFDLSGPPGRGLQAQVVVCGEVAAEEAPRHGLPVQRELMLYVVHGLLHLMGYEDGTIRGAARMAARAEELLREFLSARGAAKGTRSAKHETRNKHEGPKHE